MKKLIFSILVVQICFLNGCKKYPDGPLISFDSAKHRITGNWTVEAFYINGRDSTSLLKPYPCEMNMSFSIDGENFELNKNRCWGLGGGWTLFDNCRYLTFGAHNISDCPECKNFGPYCSQRHKWKIRRLTNHEMWLTVHYDGKDYEVDFKK